MRHVTSFVRRREKCRNTTPLVKAAKKHQTDANHIEKMKCAAIMETRMAMPNRRTIL